MAKLSKLARFCLGSSLVFLGFILLVSVFAAWIVDQDYGLRVLAGFIVSVFVGYVFTELLIRALERHHRSLKKIEVDRKGVPPCFTGFVERFVFTSTIVLTGQGGLPYVGVLIGGWLALKIATNWQRANAHGRTRGIVAMLAGLVSMFFAFLGGLIVLLPIKQIALRLSYVEIIAKFY